MIPGRVGFSVLRWVLGSADCVSTEIWISEGREHQDVHRDVSSVGESNLGVFVTLLKLMLNIVPSALLFVLTVSWPLLISARSRNGNHKRISDSADPLPQGLSHPTFSSPTHEPEESVSYLITSELPRLYRAVISQNASLTVTFPW